MTAALGRNRVLTPPAFSIGLCFTRRHGGTERRERGGSWREWRAEKELEENGERENLKRTERELEENGEYKKFSAMRQTALEENWRGTRGGFGGTWRGLGGRLREQRRQKEEERERKEKEKRKKRGKIRHPVSEREQPVQGGSGSLKR